MIPRDVSRPLLVPLTPLVVASFMFARSQQHLLPTSVLHFSRAAMAGVFVAGTYLMTWRSEQARRDMAMALTGSSNKVPPAAMVPIDLATHWVPMGVLVWDRLQERSQEKNRQTTTVVQLAWMAAATVALTACYVASTDVEYMYQIDRTRLVALFGSVHAAYLLSGAVWS